MTGDQGDTKLEDFQPKPEAAGCGACSLCCKIMAVTELKKPGNKWCSFASRSGGGCSVYESRPDGCRTFSCLWLQSQSRKPAEQMAPGLRPDRCHVVLSATTDGEGLVAMVDPAHPKAHKRGQIAKLIEHIKRKNSPVIVAIGDARHYSGPMPANIIE